MATEVLSVGEATDSILGRAILGHYVAERLLGEGGMGTVYLLRHTELPNTFAALKVLRGNPEAAGDGRELVRERFKQEALVAAAVGSHRVCKPIDVGELECGTAYIVMEYVPGSSLDAALRERGAFDLATALAIAGRIADTMAIAHQKGIVHRDLKPPNIMISEDATGDLLVKILDFGVARASGELKVAATRTRTIIGTPGYMAPEAAAALPVDGRADVFSLGVILHEMLAGAAPFSGHSEQEMLISTLAQAPPRISDRRSPSLDQVPAEVEAFLVRALAKEPSARMTMAEFRDEICRALDRCYYAQDPKRATGRHSILRTPCPPLTDMPTLSTPAGMVAVLVDKLTTPLPTAQKHGGTESDVPAEALHDQRAVTPQTETRRRRGMWLLIGLLLLGTVLAAIWLVMLRTSTVPAATMPTIQPPPTRIPEPAIAPPATATVASPVATPVTPPPVTAPSAVPPVQPAPVATPLPPPAAVRASETQPASATETTPSRHVSKRKKHSRTKSPTSTSTAATKGSPVTTPADSPAGGLKDSLE